MVIEITSISEKVAILQEDFQCNNSYLFKVSPYIKYNDELILYILIECKKAPTFIEWLSNKDVNLCLFSENQDMGKTYVYKSDKDGNKLNLILEIDKIDVNIFFEKNGYKTNIINPCKK